MNASIRKLLREPVLHFILAGWALFMAGEIHRRHIDVSRIVVTPEREALLANRYVLQFGVQPDAETLARLVQRDVEEEMLFRRGLALGLDENDEIVRRRIVQKTQFLLQDLSAPAEPSEAELSDYYLTHVDRYAEPMRITFSHVYFSLDRGDESARQRAAAALARLANGTAVVSEIGDTFPDRYHFAAYEPEQVYRLFGRTNFAEATLSVPIERWVGPFQSSYGWHLLHVSARTDARPQELASVRDKVRTDYLLDAQARTNAAAFAEVAKGFTVVREPS